MAAAEVLPEAAVELDREAELVQAVAPAQAVALDRAAALDREMELVAGAGPDRDFMAVAAQSVAGMEVHPQ